MSDDLKTTTIKVLDHLTEQFVWTNKKHLAQKIMKPEMTKLSENEYRCARCGYCFI